MNHGTNDWWSFVMSTRVTSFKTSKRLVVQQRTHQFDLAGPRMSSHADNWIHLNLPMKSSEPKK